jgi:His Kinase A (phospho-acceptor) domain
MKRRDWAVGLPAASSVIAIAMGCAALVFRGLATAPSAPDWMYVRPGAAVGLVLAGIALWVARNPRPERPARRLQVGCALALAALGTLTLAEYVFHVDLGIDRLFVFGELPDSPPGYDRMPVGTTVSFVLLGVAFVLLDAAPRARRVVDALALLIGLTSYVPLLAYAYGAGREHGIARATAIPLPTAAILTGVSISLLAVRPERGVLEIATSDSAGGRIARALLPTAIAAPALVGLVVGWGRATGLYDASYGAALEAFASVLVLSVVIFRTAHALHRTDVERHRTARTLAAETEELRSLKLELERRVAQRTAELSSANAELASFSYSVSHDLRAPLRWADGFSLALIEDYGDKLDAQARQYLQHIREAVQRMGQLIDDVLKLSRITRMDLEREPVDLGALVRQIVGGLRGTAPERKSSWSLPPIQR